MLISVSCIAWGAVKSMECSKRINSLEAAREMLMTLTQRLSFTLASTKQLLHELAVCGRFKKCKYLYSVLELCENTDLENAWKTAVKQSEQAFEEADIELLCTVGSILGKSDLQTQQGQLEMLMQQIDGAVKSAKEQREQKQKLYLTLGTLGGIMAAIILI